MWFRSHGCRMTTQSATGAPLPGLRRAGWTLDTESRVRPACSSQTLSIPWACRSLTTSSVDTSVRPAVPDGTGSAAEWARCCHTSRTPRIWDSPCGLLKGRSLAVVQTVSFPLAGWAAWLGARNLLTEEPTPPLTGSVKDAVDRLVFYGNNGFGDNFGQSQARSILADLKSAGTLGP